MFDENTKLGDFIRGIFVSSNNQSSTVETVSQSTSDPVKLSTAENNNGGEVVNNNVSQNTVDITDVTAHNANSGNLDVSQNSKGTGEIDKLKAEIERLQQVNQQLMSRVPITNSSHQQSFEQNLLNLCVGEENLKNYAG